MVGAGQGVRSPGMYGEEPQVKAHTTGNGGRAGPGNTIQACVSGNAGVKKGVLSLAGRQRPSRNNNSLSTWEGWGIWEGSLGPRSPSFLLPSIRWEWQV